MLGEFVGAVRLAPAAGGVAVIGGAFALGLRHGIDWDHIAAITDLTSSVANSDPVENLLTDEPGLQLTDESHHGLAAAASREAADGHRAASDRGSPRSRGRTAVLLPQLSTSRWQALRLGTLYALGHGVVVIALGLLALLASEILPDWVDTVMTPIVGVTLLLLAAYLYYSIYQYFRGNGPFRLRSRWMLVFAGVRRLAHAVRSRGHEHDHHHVAAGGEYGARAAFGIGMIHGVGAETGTQALVIATAVGASSTVAAVAALLAFVLGLLVSNSFVAYATATGFVSVAHRQWLYAAAGLLAATFSLVVGLLFLFGADGALPDLARLFG